MIDEVAACAEDGLKDPQIYTELGVAKQTWSDWTNEKGEHFQPDLSDALARARAKLAHRLVKIIPTMEKGWQAPVWLLTQHFPGDYSRPNADTTVNVNASANASAQASALSAVVISNEKLANLQARTQRKFEHQMHRVRERAANVPLAHPDGGSGG